MLEAFLGNGDDIHQIFCFNQMLSPLSSRENLEIWKILPLLYLCS